MDLITEQDSHHDGLEHKQTLELLHGINQEDHKVATAVAAELDSIAEVVDRIHPRMAEGGRLFYIGSGTSGRLGIVDASECPPTYGVPHGLVVGIIAGGDRAIRKAVENAEDNEAQAWLDLQAHGIDHLDTVVGISASGTAPYVLGALQACRHHGVPCVALSCNKGSAIGKVADQKIEILVGPEFVTGSTRMKAGTAQKMALNMISTAVMIRLGRVVGNKMVDMQLSNAKLVKRGTRMVMEATGLAEAEAKALLESEGSVRAAVEKYEQAQ